MAVLSIVNEVYFKGWSTFDPRYLAHFVIFFYCYPIKCMCLIT